MPGTLYVVATPLGNLEDLSPRAERVLREVDLIACEDTRHTGKLLSAFGIGTPRISYHEHNEESRAVELLDRLSEGHDIALVSDAGTPLVSDPGYRLVSRCREMSVPVVPIPGPCAAVASLSVSGLPSDGFLFAGFLPAKGPARRKRLEELGGFPATLVFYLSPHRLVEVLKDIEEELGDRPAFLARELTKLHEETVNGNLSELRSLCQSKPPRGEYTLVVAGAAAFSKPDRRVDVLAYVVGLEEARGTSRRDAIRQAAEDLDLPRNEVYRLVTDKE